VRAPCDLYTGAKRRKPVVELAKTAADFHQQVLLAPLLRRAGTRAFEEMAACALRGTFGRRSVDNGGDGPIPEWRFRRAETMARWKEVRLLDVVAPIAGVGLATAMVGAGGREVCASAREPVGGGTRGLRSICDARCRTGSQGS
jgi:hypothetical protein